MTSVSECGSVSSISEKSNLKRYKTVKYMLGGAAVLLSVAFVVGVLYSIIDFYTVRVVTTETSTASATVTSNAESTVTTPDLETIYRITQSNLLDYFPDSNNDGINIKFFHRANSKEEMNEALNGDYNVLEADVSLDRDTGMPIMAHPPTSTSDNSLDNWLSEVAASNKAMKLDIKSNDIVSPTLKSLSSHVLSVHQPVWMNADVVMGPNTLSEPIDPEKFLSNVTSIFPNLTLSLGWKTGYRPLVENEGYSWESMDKMLSLTRHLFQPVTFPARAVLLRKSWDKFLWLLEQNDKYTMTIWTGQTDPVKPEDMVFVRDNFDVSRIFYDAYDSLIDPLLEAIEMDTYPKVFYTGGNVLDVFRIPNREALKVTWMHAVNSAEELETALDDNSILMLEADVRIYGEGTEQVNDSLPVMAHDATDTMTTITLKDWLDEILRSNKTTKGLKLDFKSIGALEAALTVLEEKSASLNMPIWLNADVLEGPNSPGAWVNATRFFSQITNRFPHCTLSPGWTTGYLPNGDVYTDNMVQEMYRLCSQVRQAVTFPIRASLTRASIPQLQWLLEKSNRFSLTVWHSSPLPEGVTAEDLLEIYNSFPPSKVYFDLPTQMMDGLLQLINTQP